jgi:type II secretory pathway pseudopilin PulG
MKPGKTARPVVAADEREKCKLGKAEQTLLVESARTLIEVLAVIAVVVGVLVLIPVLLHARSKAIRRAWVANLSQIQSAKESWALENKAASSRVVAAVDMVPYLKNSVLPACPGGGVYTIGIAGTNVTCSIAGHRLPDDTWHKFP